LAWREVLVGREITTFPRSIRMLLARRRKGGRNLQALGTTT
jgi:hypothetical protein